MDLKYVTITGGLGNQMFVYAFCLELRKRGFNTILFAPRKKNSRGYGHQGYELKKLFDIVETIGLSALLLDFLLSAYSQAIRIFPTRFKRSLFKLVGVFPVSVPENFIYYPEVFSFEHKNELFMGTWQSEKYFSNALSGVREQFKFKIELISTQTENVLKELNSRNAVSIHIRRGDYLSPQYVNGFGNVCTIDYYKRAIEYINQKIENPYFYIFTDDKAWVTENFHIANSCFVAHNTGADSWQDMFLMSNCKHNIIANSSFSWWGAWLNSNPEKIVIAPQKWWSGFEQDDVVPIGWIRL